MPHKPLNTHNGAIFHSSPSPQPLLRQLLRRNTTIRNVFITQPSCKECTPYIFVTTLLALATKPKTLPLVFNPLYMILALELSYKHPLTIWFNHYNYATHSLSHNLTNSLNLYLKRPRSKPRLQKREVVPKKVQPKTPTTTPKKTEVRNPNTQPFKLVDKKRRNPE